MVLIDSNALIVLMIGLIDIRLFKNHKTTSIYDEQDFIDLTTVIERMERLVVLPNVWTEVDNLLNNFGGNYKYLYIQQLTKAITITNERYVEAVTATNHYAFSDIGLTDTLLLHVAMKHELLITSDSRLSDYATAAGIQVYDVVKNRNARL